MLRKKNNPVFDEQKYDEEIEGEGISQYPQDYEDEPIYGDNLDDYNTDVSNDAEKSRLLIETDSYINRIQLTLENKYVEKRRSVKDGVEEFKNELRQIPDTRPLANNFGISQIMGHIRSKISHVTVLANIDKEEYKFFIGRFIRDFSRQLIGHAKEWGVRPQDIRDIRRIVIDGIGLFLTRPKGDKERGYNWNPSNQNLNEDKKLGIIDKANSYFRNRRGYS